MLAVSGTCLLDAQDCNSNGRPDENDALTGASADCNANRVPDECENALFFRNGSDLVQVPRVPRFSRARDFDHDGDVDLMVGTFFSQKSAIVLLSNDGVGKFESRIVHEGGPLYFMEIADFDSDGELDMATANNDEILVFRNEGLVDFGEPTSLTPPFETRIVRGGDVNGDGTPDLISVSRDTPQAVVMLNEGKDGFSDPMLFDLPQVASAVLPGDFNGDGVLELVTLHRTAPNFDVAFYSSDGAGHFSLSTTLEIDNLRLTSLRAADLDLDGDLDLVTTAVRKLTILENDGQGVFSIARSISDTIRKDLQIADFDGNGFPDLAFNPDASTLAIRLNDGSAEFSIVHELNLERTVGPLQVADFDGDGDVDLGTISSDPDGVALILNGEELPLSLRSTTFSLPGRPHAADTGDLNGDGVLDLVLGVPNGRVITAIGDGQGGVVINRTDASSGVHTLSMTVGDFDGDGKVDAINTDTPRAIVHFHRGDGNGGFLDTTSHAVGDFPVHIESPDVNGDGHLDLAVANQRSGTITVLVNQGDGTFVDRRDYRADNVSSVTTPDLDGDGLPDLAVAAPARVSVRLNLGDGVFGNAKFYDTCCPTNDIVSGDFNRDGHVDLVTANGNARSCSVFLNRGDGTLSAAGEVPVGGSPISMITTDVNADGELDLVTANEVNQSIAVVFGRGDGTFGSQTIHRTGTGLRFVLPVDLDLDGDPDLVTVNRIAMSLTLHLNDSKVGIQSFLEEICTELDFHRFSTTPTRPVSDLERFVKFLVPVRDDPELLPLVFQNTRRFGLHQEFLGTVFPDVFPALTPEEYNAMVGLRATRKYFAGVLSLMKTDTGPLYGFSIFARYSDPEERPSVQEIGAVHERLRQSFLLGPLAYAPSSPAAVAVAREWVEPDFEVYLGAESSSSSTYEPYTRGVGHGRVRLLDPTEFLDASNRGLFSFQDVLVLREAPRDIEGVVGGVITAELQGELSHVALRTARRGTPNAFVADAFEVFAPFEGKLVRLEVKGSRFDVREATLDEAEAWWVDNRPQISALPEVDESHADLTGLGEIAALEALSEELEPRFGGKASNLGRLQGILDGDFEEFRERGFVIPVRYYFEFLRSNFRTSFVGPHLVSYEEYLQELLVHPDFIADPELRFRVLEEFRDRMREEGLVDGELVERLSSRIEEVFGSKQVMVRFRSSSSSEDVLEFNGAGLYDSTGACVLDTLDADLLGPSHCELERNNERPIERALKRVWSSLWNFRAFEERAFFGLPQDRAAMAILVTRAFLDEVANGVAFTGNPSNPSDRRLIVTSQVDEFSVVSPEPGVLPAKDILEVEDGVVRTIVRATPSSLQPPGVNVLSDDDLRELGRLLAHTDQHFPLDLGEHSREKVLLDIEFKKESDASLAVKQVRPFLITAPEEPSPTFELEIPANTSICGAFSWQRDARDEYELKSMVLLQAGTVLLPTRVETFTGRLFQEVLFGPLRERAVPVEDGVFRVVSSQTGNGRVHYEFEYEQELTLESGDRLLLRLELPDFDAIDGEAVVLTEIVDADYVTDRVALRATLIRVDESTESLVYASCDYESLPLWEIRAELDDGTTLELAERYLPELNLDQGPARLVHARASLDPLGPENVQRETSDYWNLVYSSERHNVRVHHWVLLEPPVTVNGIAAPIRAIELVQPDSTTGLETGEGRYLDADLQVIATRSLKFYERTQVNGGGPRVFPFSRGDPNVDGSIDASDALMLMRYLFLGAEPPECEKSADANDDGRVNITDAVRVLLHAFSGAGPLPTPFGACGQDPTSDVLSCVSFRACP